MLQRNLVYTGLMRAFVDRTSSRRCAPIPVIAGPREDSEVSQRADFGRPCGAIVETQSSGQASHLERSTVDGRLRGASHNLVLLLFV